MKVNIKFDGDGYPLKNKIKIHKRDTWDMAYTLSHVIHPMLVQLKNTKHGAPCVRDKDVPKHLRRAAAGECSKYEADDLWFDRWDWVMDEMIWGFNEMKKHSFEDIWDKDYQDRLQNAMRLFGKYYRNLWD